MFKALPFDIFRVRTLHTMINATVVVLLKNKYFTNKDNEHMMLMINVCRKKF